MNATPAASHRPTSEASDAGTAAEPIAGFSRCHEGILNHLEALAGLPALLEPAARARQVAADMLAFFRPVIYEHHQDEERDLFPAVLASAGAGEERERVSAIVQRLTHEHRAVETAFAALEPGLKAAAKGQDTPLSADQVAALVRDYSGHARYEEREFLPLAQLILGRNSNHMAALGLSIHLRHALPEVLAKYGSRI